MKPVTENALVRRVNRALAPAGQAIRRCSDNSRWFHTLGRFYGVNADRNVVGAHVDLEEWAKELGVLREGEVLA